MPGSYACYTIPGVQFRPLATLAMFMVAAAFREGESHGGAMQFLRVARSESGTEDL